MSRAGTVVILAAGQGTRMKSALPKVLHPLCGKPMISWVVDLALTLDPERILVVVGHEGDAVEEVVKAGAGAERIACVTQEPQNGTGHALQVCTEALGDDPGTVVVLYGDMPVLAPETLAALCDASEGAGADGMALMTAFPDSPRAFGRILRDGTGRFEGIVEEKDATPHERAIPEVNIGVYAFPGRLLLEYLPKLESDNAQGEYYLTDIPVLMARDHREVATVEVEDSDETIGVNTITHLAEARWALQMRILEEHMLAGVRIEDPGSVTIDVDVEIGVGTEILPCTVIRSGVKIGAGCEVGPFTHLRVGTVLKDGAEVGNFTECKKSTLGEGTKAKHLSYIGDARIGAGANIGAGTIFANYDGLEKHQTVVGDRAFVGSGTTIVAPNQIGEDATTGAGSVITRKAKVGPGEVWAGIPAKRLEGSKGPQEERKARAAKKA
jgi:bifunctional UDP-N-acetylglucosamine pyrophosphorylase / glucosamine-1-phosphate N-acetyltransferase